MEDQLPMETNLEIDPNKFVEYNQMNFNPYFHLSVQIMKCQNAMDKDDLKLGFAKFRNNVEVLETLAKGTRIVGKSFDETVKEFVESSEYKLLAPETQSIRLSHKKFFLILEAFQKATKLVGALKM